MPWPTGRALSCELPSRNSLALLGLLVRLVDVGARCGCTQPSMLTTTGQYCTVFRDVRLTRSALESAGELCRLASPLSALHPLRLNRAELLRAHSGADLRCGVRRRAGRDRRRRRRRLPMAFLLKSLFRGTQPAPADADACDEALKTELAPEVRVVSAGEAEAAEYAPRSTSGSSQDLASVKGSLVPRQQSEAAALAAEIAQLSHAPPPRGAPLGCPCAAPARSKLRTALCRALRWRTASGNLKLLLASRVTGMVNPNGARKLAWDWLVVCFVVYTTLATPLDLAFFDTACAQADSTASCRVRQRDLVYRA